MDALILAVGHRAYREMPLDDYISKLVSRGCIIDVKGILDPNVAKVEDAARRSRSAANYIRVIR